MSNLKDNQIKYWKRLFEEVGVMYKKLESENKKLLEQIADFTDEVNGLREKNKNLRKCVESISKNTCCDGCQEAKKVALKCLKELKQIEDEK